MSQQLRSVCHAPAKLFKWPKIPSDANFDPFGSVIGFVPPEKHVSSFVEVDEMDDEYIPLEDGEEVPQFATITAEERVALDRDIDNAPVPVYKLTDFPDFPRPGDGPRMGIELPWIHPKYDHKVAEPPSSPSPTITRESTVESTPARPNRRDIATLKAAATAATSSTGNDSTENSSESNTELIPLEVFLFNEPNYDSSNPSRRPFTYLNTISLPQHILRKPQDVIDAVIIELGGEEELGNTEEDLVDPQQKIVGNVCVWGTYIEKGRRLQETWHLATIDVFKQYLATKKEMGEAGVVGTYLVDVKVLLWRRGEAVKARMARKIKLPERDNVGEAADDQVHAGEKEIEAGDGQIAAEEDDDDDEDWMEVDE